ncbi:hypothetical protein NDU88_010952 [Pleurodeles waltl]|uniref:Uncharacterized protein n=1 Tax=Pleurodeles waltl TaxID=8319 RepID=A0AAV7QZM5_PLEWA|nr:hypothetical protein NDU88_010952 [Pleurodeles waltl]
MAQKNGIHPVPGALNSDPDLLVPPLTPLQVYLKKSGVTNKVASHKDPTTAFFSNPDTVEGLPIPLVPQTLGKRRLGASHQGSPGITRWIVYYFSTSRTYKRRASLSMQSLPSWIKQLLQGLVQMATNQHSGARVVTLHLKSVRRLADQEEKVPFLVRYGRA